MNGFEIEKLNNQENTELIDNLKCVICQFCVARDPAICSIKNSHIYCFKCIQNIKKCAMCKIKMPQNKHELKNTLLRQIIATQFSIKCSYHKNGCESILKCSDQEVQTHEKNCGYEEMKCIQFLCNETFLKKYMQKQP